MKFLIAFLDKGLPFDGDDILNISLGGSETAVYYMARGLAALGHEVYVFNHCKNPGEYYGVNYHHWDTWKNMKSCIDWDVVIGNRSTSYLADPFVQCKLGITWFHDTPPENSEDWIRYVWASDKLFFPSNYHARLFAEIGSGRPPGWLDPLIFVTRNGVDLEAIKKIFRGQGLRNRIEKQYLYTSRPERGLQVLLTSIWPRLYESDPSRTLLITHYDVKTPNTPQVYQDFIQSISALIEQTPGVRKVGPLSKKNLYQLMCSSAALLYPCHAPEISCISAMEAMACGLPVITSEQFVFPETIGDSGILIPGSPWDLTYQDAFIEAVTALDSPECWTQYSQKGLQRAQYLDWGPVAVQWQTFFENFFEERFQKNISGICKQLIYESDLVVASILAQAYPQECETELPLLQTWLQNQEDQQFSERYSEHSGDQLIEHSGRFKSICDFIPKKATTLLDVGCGIGQLFYHVEQHAPQIRRMVGLDFSDSLIERARSFITKHLKNPGNVHLVTNTVQAFSRTCDETFDVVVCAEVLEHTIDYQMTITYLESLCSPGGTVILTLPVGPWEHGFPDQPQASLYCPVKQHCHHFTWSDLRDIFGSKRAFEVTYQQAGLNLRGDVIGNWIIRWTVNPSKKTGNRNIWKKIKTTRPYQIVTGNIIVKNEEDQIGKSIRSVIPLIDNLVIYDTGSDDRTQQRVLETCNSSLYGGYQLVEGYFDMETGFGGARNRCLSYCPPNTSWVLWWDADECLLQPENVRKYLRSPLFPGFIITQTHLMLDVQAPPDTPVRLFRFDPGVSFYGVVHEHPETGINQPLEPMLQIPDATFVHYGYLTEGIRRYKCAVRNLPLLLEDRKRYPQRYLGLICLMRDYTHLADWDFERIKTFGGRSVEFLRMVVRIYHEVFASFESEPLQRRWWVHAFTYYQKALRYLGLSGIPAYEGRPDSVPFESCILLTASFGGAPEGFQKLIPDRRWFLSEEEFTLFMQQQTQEVCKQLTILHMGEAPPRFWLPS